MLESTETNMKNFDVYSFGVISASALYLLKSEFPARGGYAEMTPNEYTSKFFMFVPVDSNI